jgi:hypothetical protein
VKSNKVFAIPGNRLMTPGKMLMLSVLRPALLGRMLARVDIVLTALTAPGESLTTPGERLTVPGRIFDLPC